MPKPCFSGGRPKSWGKEPSLVFTIMAIYCGNTLRWWSIASLNPSGTGLKGFSGER